MNSFCDEKLQFVWSLNSDAPFMLPASGELAIESKPTPKITSPHNTSLERLVGQFLSLIDFQQS
jgi:hypothetical protein